ncbi:MAG: hypothetical protein GQ534_08575 [Candidatus Delongbacteria bacterium]|nr:hypothetical protein [Candidatus Delongbacteria bacterium]
MKSLKNITSANPFITSLIFPIVIMFLGLIGNLYFKFTITGNSKLDSDIIKFTTIISMILLFLAIYLIFKNWNNNNFYKVKCKKYLKNLHKSIKAHYKHHPASSMLMAMIAQRTAADLFYEDGELLYLQEYLDILEESLSENLKKCVFIARTKPSDWFSNPQDNRLIAEIKRKGEAYLVKQGELKKELKGNIEIERYVILDRDDWDNDEKKKDFIDLHKYNDVTLHFCPFQNIPEKYKIDDTAIFTDKKDRIWVVRSPDLNENTISNYASNSLPLHIKVKLEDRQDVINGWYKHFLKDLHQAKEKTYKK